MDDEEFVWKSEITDARKIAFSLLPRISCFLRHCTKATNALIFLGRVGPVLVNSEIEIHVTIARHCLIYLEPRFRRKSCSRRAPCLLYFKQLLTVHRPHHSSAHLALPHISRLLSSQPHHSHLTSPTERNHSFRTLHAGRIQSPSPITSLQSAPSVWAIPRPHPAPPLSILHSCLASYSETQQHTPFF